MSGKFIFDLWRNLSAIVNTWPVYLWCIVGTFCFCFCCLQWEEWTVREQLGIDSFGTIFYLAIAYITSLPVLLAWIWHHRSLQYIKTLTND